MVEVRPVCFRDSEAFNKGYGSRANERRENKGHDAQQEAPEQQQKKRKVRHKDGHKRYNRTKKSINGSASRGYRYRCSSVEVGNDNKPGCRDKQHTGGREDQGN